MANLQRDTNTRNRYVLCIVVALSLVSVVLWRLFAVAPATTPVAEVESAPPGINRLLEIVAPFRRDSWTSAVAQAIATQRDYFQQDLHLSYQPGDRGLEGWDLIHQRGVDGHTIMVGGPKSLIAIARDRQPRFDRSQLAVVFLVSNYHHAIGVHPESPVRDWQSLVEQSRLSPKKMTIAGSKVPLLSAEYILRQAEVDVVYRKMSTSKAVAALQAGEVDMVVGTAIRLLVKHPKTVRPLLATGSGPLSSIEKHYAELPVAQDFGYDGLSTPIWIGMHPDTSAQQQGHISRAFAHLLEQDGFKKKLQKKGHLGTSHTRPEAVAEINRYLLAASQSELSYFD